MNTISDYAKVHQSISKQVFDNVELFWFGGFERRIDCCKSLPIPFLSDVKRATEHMEYQEKYAKPRRTRLFYRDVATKLVHCSRLRKSLNILDYLDAMSSLYMEIDGKCSKAQGNYYNAFQTDRRKAETEGNTWSAYKEILFVLDGIKSLAIPEEELLELRLSPLRRDNGNLCDAFQVFLHHSKDYGFRLSSMIPALIKELEARRNNYASSTQEGDALDKIISFVKSVWDRTQTAGEEHMHILQQELTEFLPVVQQASDNIAMEHGDLYDKNIVEQSKYALWYLWHTPVLITEDLPEIRFCSTISLSSN
jgi:hypothetical protein